MKVVNGELAFRRREGEGWVAAGTLGWVEQVKLAGDCGQSTIVRAGSLEPHFGKQGGTRRVDDRRVSSRWSAG